MPIDEPWMPGYGFGGSDGGAADPPGAGICMLGIAS
jgi:hypothetical protein